MSRQSREPIADLPEIAKAYARAYRCPDCHAETDLRNVDGVAVLDVRHDPTCPALAGVSR